MKKIVVGVSAAVMIDLGLMKEPTVEEGGVGAMKGMEGQKQCPKFATVQEGNADGRMGGGWLAEWS